MHRTRIKICGFTRESDIEAAVNAGADAIGLNLYAPSSRSVTVQRAAELAKVMPPFVTPVLLFVNASDELLAQAVAAIPHAVLQFHGDETPAQCAAAQRTYIRAARMQTGFDLLNFMAEFANAQAVLVDAHVDGYGGGGKVFDWSLIPKNVPLPVVLSGGLHAGNVAAGVEQVRPWAVDVSSGVESAKGIKDALAMRQFCDAVRAADARIASLST
jgi:phosphoribosylanthranilate isomerase